MDATDDHVSLDKFIAIIKLDETLVNIPEAHVEAVVKCIVDVLDKIPGQVYLSKRGIRRDLSEQILVKIPPNTSFH